MYLVSIVLYTLKEDLEQEEEIAKNAISRIEYIILAWDIYVKPVCETL